MKVLQNNFQDTYIVALGNDDWLSKLRISGHFLSQQMKLIRELIKNKTDMTALEISRMVEKNILDAGLTPTFKDYRGFPESVCISVNNELVHGIPKDTKFKDGDVVSFDFGVTLDGVASDSARTFIYGENKDYEKLINTTKLCLAEAIKSIKLDKKIGILGHTIYKTARENGFDVISSFGGHGIELNKIHSQPFISNKAEINSGIRFQPGMTLAIEPLLVPAGSSTHPKIGDDKWTVFTEKVGAHYEDTIYIHNYGGVEVITRDR